MEVCPAFIDESGVLSSSITEQPVYGVGLLVVPETRSITDSLYRVHFNFLSDRMTARNKLRNDIRAGRDRPTIEDLDRLMWSTSHHEYKFADVTRFNVQQYVDILNTYFSFPGVEFHSLILDRRDPDASLEQWNNDTWEAYTHFVSELLKKRLSRDVFAIVDLQGKPDKSDVYLEDVLCSVDSVKGCLRATSDMSIYLQIVDVLLGCVQFDVRYQMDYYRATSRRAQDKRRLVDFVKSRLGMRTASPFLPNDRISNEWRAPSVFTVCRGMWGKGRVRL